MVEDPPQVPPCEDDGGHAALQSFFNRHPRILALTGAGISTASGIPGYRDADGNWQRRQPVTHQEFTSSQSVRKRYWARSMLGWPLMAGAVPNTAHAAVASLERSGHLARVVTQNVDGLHQKAGNAGVIDLHGRLDSVICLDCDARVERDWLQSELEARNPGFRRTTVQAAPDGDADVESDFEAFAIPCCPACGGMLKPDVVFYGGSVPRQRADAALEAVRATDAVLVIGSSLMVRSSFRLCEAAATERKPIAAINIGRTRADHLFDLKVACDCGIALAQLVQALRGID